MQSNSARETEPQDAITSSIGALILGIADAAARVAQSQVYPGYLACRIKRALKGFDDSLRADEQIVAGLGDIETIGDARYAIPLTDCHGTEYRITVEVLPRAGKAGGL